MSPASAEPAAGTVKNCGIDRNRREAGKRMIVRDNQFYAYFSAHGDFDPASVTARLGFDPTDSWIKGSTNRIGRERKFSRWSLYSRLTTDEPLEAHIADVPAQRDMIGSRARDVAIEANGMMQLVAYLHEGWPGLHFDQSITAGLARHALAVDFDFYWLYSDLREDTES